MDNEYIKAMEKGYRLVEQATNDFDRLWFKYTLWGWQWWFGIGLSIIPWILWIIFRKKDSTDRLLLAGLFVMIVSAWLDNTGILFGLWSYYKKVLPFTVAFIPWDFTLLPVAVMSILQIKPKIKPIYKAIVLSVFSSYIVEPFFVWIGLYNPKHWNHFYSVPIVFAIYLVSDWISKRAHFEKLEK